MLLQEASSRRSATMEMALAPSAFNSLSAAEFLLSSRPATAIAAPACARPFAMPSPMPPLPPVTSAVLPPRSNGLMRRLCNEARPIEAEEERIIDPAEAAASRRHGLGGAKPRQAVFRGIRLGRALRGSGGGHCEGLRAEARSGTRALLDGRHGRRAGGFCLSGQNRSIDGEVAPAAGPPAGSRPRPGQAARP